MTVTELIAHLRRFDGDHRVVVRGYRRASTISCRRAPSRSCLTCTTKTGTGPTIRSNPPPSRRY
jgi:hypothetical protein